MNKSKRLLACALAVTMAFGMTACEDEAAVNPSGASQASNVQPNQPGAVTTATSASTTTDPRPLILPCISPPAMQEQLNSALSMISRATRRVLNSA